MGTVTQERKYALIKLGKSDWGLPGNDGETMWRIVHSTDPWPGEDGRDEDRTTWCVYVCRYSIRELQEDAESDRATFGLGIDLDDWESWEYENGGFDTRKEAIAQALELEEERALRAQAQET